MLPATATSYVKTHPLISRSRNVGNANRFLNWIDVIPDIARLPNMIDTNINLSIVCAFVTIFLCVLNIDVVFLLFV